MGLVIGVRGGKEKVQIGECTLSIVAIDGNSVVLHLEAPQNVKIDRIQMEYEWKGKNKKKKLDQRGNVYGTERRKKWCHSESTQQKSKLLRKNLVHSKSLSITPLRTSDGIGNTSSSCFLCFPDGCKCKF
jgi:sRNA-binding carbon storage regulator CsrA